MNKPKLLLFFILLSLVQLTLLEYFKVFGLKPDLILISVVIASLFFKFSSSIIFAVLSGIIKDAFLGPSLGINTLLFPLWSFLIRKLSRKIEIDNLAIRLSLIYIIALLNNLLCGLAMIYSVESIPLGLFLSRVFLAPVYTAIVFSLIYRISIKWLGQR